MLARGSANPLKCEQRNSVLDRVREEVLGGKTAREVAEHNEIQEITGGRKAKTSDKVANKRDPIGPKRRPRHGLPEPKE